MAEVTEQTSTTTTEEAPPNVPTGLEPTTQPLPEETVITWTASEFIAHEKSGGWYLKLVGVAILLSAITYLATRDIITCVVIVFCAGILAIMAARKPKQLPYRLDTHGVTVGPKLYTYNQFRSFSIMPEGAFSSIEFMPLKRFATTATIYYAPEDEERIVKLLSDRLPYEPSRRDPVDQLMRRIRF